MIHPVILIVWRLLVLHAPGGAEIDVNPMEITSIRDRNPEDHNKLVTDEVKCVINMSDGKYISVIEPCSTVRQQIKDLIEGEPEP